MEQVKRITGWQPLNAYCDRGYRGAGKDITDTMDHLEDGGYSPFHAGRKKMSGQAVDHEGQCQSFASLSADLS